MARTKKEFVADFCESLNARSNTTTTRKEAEKAITIVIEQIVKEIIAHGCFTWPDFGKIEVVDVSTRKGRNPKTGEEVEIPPHKKLKLSPSSVLTKLVNEKKVPKKYKPGEPLDNPLPLPKPPF